MSTAQTLLLRELDRKRQLADRAQLEESVNQAKWAQTAAVGMDMMEREQGMEQARKDAEHGRALKYAQAQAKAQTELGQAPSSYADPEQQRVAEVSALGTQAGMEGAAAEAEAADRAAMNKYLQQLQVEGLKEGGRETRSLREQDQFFANLGLREDIAGQRSEDYQGRSAAIGREGQLNRAAAAQPMLLKGLGDAAKRAADLAKLRSGTHIIEGEAMRQDLAPILDHLGLLNEMSTEVLKSMTDEYGDETVKKAFGSLFEKGQTSGGQKPTPEEVQRALQEAEAEDLLGDR